MRDVKHPPAIPPFSRQLETWLQAPGPKTLGSLDTAFAAKGFAIIMLVLMFVPALPIPTGGITHLFEIITMLVALELIAGRKTLWLPAKWLRLRLGTVIEGKAIPLIARRIRWFEKWSRPRLITLTNHPLAMRVIGLAVLLLALSAFLAPPFSGLDTLPSLGVVIICLGLILDDGALLLAGAIVGVTGIALLLSLAASVLTLLSSL